MMHRLCPYCLILLGCLWVFPGILPAEQAETSQDEESARSEQTFTHFSHDLEWPEIDELITVATLQNYNTRLVVASTLILGIASGVIGAFLLLRKRSLMGDALSHACLPGIGIFFIIMVMAGGSGKYLPGLLLGAALTGVAGVGLVLLIRNNTRIKDDAAMGIILSVFFGIGVAILGMVQAMPGASAAGLETFIYGKTASMIFQDFILLSGVAVLVILVSFLLFKEFTLLCFDEDFAASQGWPVHLLDVIMLILVAAVTVVGLQAVGLILIIAFLIIPAAAARFWTDRLSLMILYAALIGGVSGWLGSSISALFPGMPAGAIIVLVAAGIFTLSMIFGSARGILMRFIHQYRLRRKIGKQHLFRAIIEILEDQHRQEGTPLANRRIALDKLQKHRSWKPSLLRSLINRAARQDQIEHFDGKTVRLSESGYGEASRTTRNHRLWEMYLIEHAEVAPNHVDRDADAVEHVLSAEMVRHLEEKLSREKTEISIPDSPHPIIQKEHK